MVGQPQHSGQIAAFDGLPLVHRTWEADEPVGGVLVVHGLAEHGLRYGHVLRELVPAGFSVMTWDQRGHGESGGLRGHIERFADYCDDLEMMVGFARERLPAPLFVLAPSMGGLVACTLAVAGRLKVSGLALSNPALSVKMPVPRWKLIAAPLLSRALPRAPVPTDIPAALISRDPEEVRKYTDAPLVFTSTSARWGHEFLTAQDKIQQAAHRFTMAPTLVQLGTADGITDAAFSERFFGDCGSDDCRIEAYPDAYHELYNEPAEHRAPILADLRGWLLEKAART